MYSWIEIHPQVLCLPFCKRAAALIFFFFFLSLLAVVAPRTWCGTAYWEQRSWCRKRTKTWSSEFSWRSVKTLDTGQCQLFFCSRRWFFFFQPHLPSCCFSAVWRRSYVSAQSPGFGCAQHPQLRRRHQLLGRNEGRQRKWFGRFSSCHKTRETQLTHVRVIVSWQNFGAPSFDDKKLEVVAVFGSMQMAVSRVINIQHHRIAQVTLQCTAVFCILHCGSIIFKYYYS